jgi:hypothetical protein
MKAFPALFQNQNKYMKHNKLASILMAVSTLFAPEISATQSVETTNQTQSTRDQREHKYKVPEPSFELRKLPSYLGFQSGPDHRRILNQRQYRKLCRQNPSMYKSKKHRSKN